ncbi:MAG: hypothetical protein RIA71_16160 [Oceanicaulis sp.]
MILDNLTRAFKTQNWFAVALEFIIVIAGVVIGFQVNAWNEGRQDRALEADILVRLHGEFTQLRDVGDRYLEAKIRQRDLLSAWIEAGDANGSLDVETFRELTLDFHRQRDADRAESLTDATISELLLTALSGSSAPEPSITFQQLVASGDLRLLQSQSLRAALGRYDISRAATLIAQQSNEATSSLAMRGDILASAWNAAAPGGEAGVAAIIADPGFVDWLRTMYALNAYNTNWYQSTQDEIAPVITLLEQEMDR